VRGSALCGYCVPSNGRTSASLASRALGLVLNALALFNTRYMDAAITQLREDRFDVRDEEVARLSPFVRHHINMLGRYSFQLPDLPGGLRDPAARRRQTPQHGAFVDDVAAPERRVLTGWLGPRSFPRLGQPARLRRVTRRRMSFVVGIAIACVALGRSRLRPPCLIADLNDISWSLRRCPGELSQVNQSLDPVGDLDEDAERDQLGDLARQFLPHRDGVGEYLKGSGCVAFKDSLTSRFHESNSRNSHETRCPTCTTSVLPRSVARTVQRRR